MRHCPRPAARAVIVALALALLAAACGGDDNDDSAEGAATTTAAASATTGAAVSASSTTAPAAQPTSMEAWESLWATERAAVVKRIKDNKWGRSADGKAVVGPEGFNVDLTKCPSGWSETEGLTDTEIKIGQTLPQSGAAADYGNVGKGMVTMFDDASSRGMFKDSQGKTRKVNYIVKDDGYDPARTIPLTDELIDFEHVFAMTTLGSPNTMKTYDS
jgi:branched-chain amino acid transport system substrate-binding protein